MFRSINLVLPCIGFHKQLVQRDLLKRGNADDLKDFIQRRTQVLSLLEDRNKQIGAQGGPDLDANAVGRSAEETAQTQMLFEPSPKRLDAPAPTVDLGDEWRGQGELIA